MSADDKMAEALARIEHKIDVLMALMARSMTPSPANQTFLENVMKYEQVGSKSHKCFLCAKSVEYIVNTADAVVVRKCGCTTGKIALDLKAFAPPALPGSTKENDSGEQQQEDRRNPSPRGGPRR